MRSGRRIRKEAKADQSEAFLKFGGCLVAGSIVFAFDKLTPPPGLTAKAEIKLLSLEAKRQKNIKSKNRKELVVIAITVNYNQQQRC